MFGYLLPILIDVIDASPFEEATLIGIPLVALIEAGVIYYQTESKALAIVGFLESIIPGIDVLPMATISKLIAGKKY